MSVMQTKTPAEKQLAASEQARLMELERVVSSGLAVFMEVGAALLEIRDSRLYQATHRTFEVYCRDRWHISRKRAYQLINAASIAGDLIRDGEQAPTREAHVSPLSALPKSDRREAWRESVATSGGNVTMSHVQAVVDRRKGLEAEVLPASPDRTITVSIDPVRAANQLAALFDKDQLRAVVRRLTLLI